MAKLLTKDQIKPILTILNLRKTEELNNLGVATDDDVLKKIEAENRERIAPIQKVVDEELKPLIDKINGMIKDFDGDVDIYAHSPRRNNRGLFNGVMYVPQLPLTNVYHYFDATKRSYGRSYFITGEQEKSVATRRTMSSKDVEMKYALIEAKIMLSEDYKEVKKILDDNGITTPDAVPAATE